MKKFRFSLERVQRVRKIEEALRLAEKKRAERALLAQQQKLNMFTIEHDAQCESMEAAMLSTFRISERQTDWTYLQRLDRIIGYQAGVVKEYTLTNNEARKRFLLARQKSLGLEKLGNAQFESWKKELIDLEQKIADDRPRQIDRNIK